MQKNRSARQDESKGQKSALGIALAGVSAVANLIRLVLDLVRL
ncbi:hypothetical protein [Streptomyces neyagawaensis]|uniref:Uncharacterized protein n=1 Tax=Streptomyces neyagawaensis TaxID=42238 RepID=A0ABV3B2H8_9ACTN